MRLLWHALANDIPAFGLDSDSVTLGGAWKWKHPGYRPEMPQFCPYLPLEGFAGIGYFPNRYSVKQRSRRFKSKAKVIQVVRLRCGGGQDLAERYLLALQKKGAFR
jgi:hypothetical protein